MLVMAAPRVGCLGGRLGGGRGGWRFYVMTTVLGGPVDGDCGGGGGRVGNEGLREKWSEGFGKGLTE